MSKSEFNDYLLMFGKVLRFSRYLPENSIVLFDEIAARWGKLILLALLSYHSHHNSTSVIYSELILIKLCLKPSVSFFFIYLKAMS